MLPDSGDKCNLKQGLIDYLEILQMAGVHEISLAMPAATLHLQTPPPMNYVQETLTPKTIDDRHTALLQLAQKVSKCTECPELVANRTQTVFGVGNPYAELVFLGEAPGANEDKEGIPFIGRAGQLLTDMIIKGMKIRREDVYICNVLRCRPPENRDPTPTEAINCRKFLDATLEVIKPKFICCLGAPASKNLLNSELTIGKLRGKVHDYHGVKVVCTYHPAYLLRNPPAKTETWKDLQLLMNEMGLPVAGK